MNLELNPLEHIINTWTVIYLPDTKTKFNGKLTVTNTRLVFDMLYNISSIEAVIESAYLVKNGEYSTLEIPKKDISSVETEKSFLQKKIIIRLTNGKEFIFSYGVMNVDRIAEAIKAI